MITVYGRENCVSCKTTKRFLESKGVTYEYVDVDYASQDIHDWISENGYMSLPIVQTDSDVWTGLNMMKLQNYAKGVK